MPIMYKDGLDNVHPEEANPLSDDFTAVRLSALRSIFSEDRIPTEINILNEDMVLILTTTLAKVPLEKIKFYEEGKMKINYSLEEATIVKGPFINPEGQKGFMLIILVDGETHSEAYWKKTVGDSYELEQLITPQDEVLNAHLLNPNSKRKSIQMPGTKMYIPFKRRIEF